MKNKTTLHMMKGTGALLILLFAQSIFAQGIHVSVNRKDILIGERITYVMQIDLPSPQYNVSINIPDSIPHFEIISKTGGNGNDKAGNHLWRQTLVLTSFDSGSWQFPTLSYRINHLNTSSQNLYTDTFRVNVGYMPIDKGGNPRDIKTITEVYFFDWFWVWVGAGVLLLLLIAYLLYRYFKKTKKDPGAAAALGAYEEAIRNLEELRRANKEHVFTVKEFHTKLADVVKTYYGKKNNQNFLNKTTEEILLKLKSHELNAETRTHAASALQTGDAVKFAKYHSSYLENEEALNYLKAAIEETEKSLSKKT